MTTGKNEVFIGLQHENCYLVEGKEPLVGGVYWETFPGGGRMSKSWYT